MKCEFCNNDFKTISSLNYHKKTAKYCASIQNNNISKSFLCKYCSKSFSTKQNLNAHIETCKEYKLEENIKKIMIQDKVLNEKVLFLEQQLLIKDNQIKELQDKLENIAIQSHTDKQLKIQHLTKKYVNKIPRVQYEEKNVIYIITTERLKKDNIYILGKATNLTSRLSTYNKSDEHEVIYYQECPGDSMPIVENMVFNKLEEYRQSANRERFVLPEELKVDIFVDVIKNSINFFCK
jgi:hypothetical protein